MVSKITKTSMIAKRIRHRRRSSTKDQCRRSLQEEFRKGRPKSVVPKTIDTVSELIWQDRHMTYILHENWTVDKFVRVGSHTICLKKGLCGLVEENAQKIRSRCFEIRLWHMKNRGSTRMSQKVNSSRLFQANIRMFFGKN